MNIQFQQLMNAARRLTRAGNLQAATAAIRSALGAAGPTPGLATPSVAATDAIDVDVRELPGVQAPEAFEQESFVAGSFGAGVAGRDYKLYIPPAAGNARLPLLVMLHGCTQNPDDFAAGTAMNELARAQGFYVLYPAQSRKANAHGCWNWFKHSHQQRGRGEAGLLADMTRDVMARHLIDPRRVYIAGLSAGGAMAAILGAVYPDLYAAVGVHSGLPAGAATNLAGALAAMKGGAASAAATAHGVPTIVFHGDADSTVHAANADQVIAACAGQVTAAQTQRLQEAGGRPCTRRIYQDAAGRVVAEHWLVHGAAHAWSGGSALGSYTDSQGPDASAQMVRFFFEHPRPALQ